MDGSYLNFYKNWWLEMRPTNIEKNSFFQELKKFVRDFDLKDKKILEIGSGNGKFQDIVENYTGLDIVEDLKKYYHKPYFVLDSSGIYPFNDSFFDAVFTYAVFEHIPNINLALNEMLRVLKPGGVILFNAAWFVRPWAAGGYAIRPYKDLSFREKIIKFLIPLRNNLFFRLLYVVPKRIFRTFLFLVNKKNFYNLKYKKLKANYKKFWDSDSDACNHIDPHSMILWFFAHNCEVLNYPNILKAFFVRTGSLIIRKK